MDLHFGDEVGEDDSNLVEDREAVLVGISGIVSLSQVQMPQQEEHDVDNEPNEPQLVVDVQLVTVKSSFQESM